MTSVLDKERVLFELAHVRFDYEPGSPLFQGLRLTIQRGEAFAVLGPGGSGKSTLLKLMAGLLKPQKGEVNFDGIALSKATRADWRGIRRRIGMTFQRSGLFDSMSCEENLDFPLREYFELSYVERREKIERALGDVGLQGQGKLRIPEMSGGMQKRLGIARALIVSPEVVLYDDPTAGLDPITSRAILNLITEMKRKYRMTIVTVTSDPAQAFAMADRVGFLAGGAFVQVGTPEELESSRHPAVHQFLMGTAEGAP